MQAWKSPTPRGGATEGSVSVAGAPVSNGSPGTYGQSGPFKRVSGLILRPGRSDALVAAGLSHPTDDKCAAPKRWPAARGARIGLVRAVPRQQRGRGVVGEVKARGRGRRAPSLNFRRSWPLTAHTRSPTATCCPPILRSILVPHPQLVEIEILLLVRRPVRRPLWFQTLGLGTPFRR